jgi:hypothetical protein
MNDQNTPLASTNTVIEHSEKWEVRDGDGRLIVNESTFRALQDHIRELQFWIDETVENCSVCSDPPKRL